MTAHRPRFIRGNTSMAMTNKCTAHDGFCTQKMA